MTTENPGRRTEWVFALGNDRLLVIRADNPSELGQGGDRYGTFRAYLGREGEPMESIGQVGIDAMRDGRTRIETSIGRVCAPSPFRTGERPTLNDAPIEFLNIKDWDIDERDDGTATAIRRQGT